MRNGHSVTFGVKDCWGRTDKRFGIRGLGQTRRMSRVAVQKGLRSESPIEQLHPCLLFHWTTPGREAVRFQADMDAGSQRPANGCARVAGKRWGFAAGRLARTTRIATQAGNETDGNASDRPHREAGGELGEEAARELTRSFSPRHMIPINGFGRFRQSGRAHVNGRCHARVTSSAAGCLRLVAAANSYKAGLVHTS